MFLLLGLPHPALSVHCHNSLIQMCLEKTVLILIRPPLLSSALKVIPLTTAATPVVQKV